jgi:ribosomal protein S18 acetylase RimI-like enzyme
VLDDRAYDRLSVDVPAAREGVVHVFDQASRCGAFMRGQPDWKAERPATAMARRDIHSAPAATLPDGLLLRQVNRLDSGTHDSVPLKDAVAVALASDPGITEPPEEFAGSLRALPPAVRLFAAIDAEGVARATSGCDVFGEDARVFFVNTQPNWRRRGIARAMTLAALRAAVTSGAHRAVLDATEAGAPLYTGLGFEIVGRFTRYSRVA